MLGFLNTFFKIAAVACAALMIWQVALLFWRAKYAETLLARTPEQRKRLMDAYRVELLVIRLLLWLLPIMSVALPVAVYFFMPQVGALLVLTVTIELTLVSGAEYFFERWLVRYVTEHEQILPVSEND